MIKSAPYAFIFCIDLDACHENVHAKFQVSNCSVTKDMGKRVNSPSPQKTNSPSPQVSHFRNVSTQVQVATPPVLAGTTPPVQKSKLPQSLMHGTHFGQECRVTPTMHGCFAHMLLHMLDRF